jgi:hypothetical protein
MLRPVSVPFRGSEAVAAGTLTKAMLRGPRFVRLFPDVYLAATARPTPLLRALAAFLLVEPAGGVLAGYSAAELLRRSCGPWAAPAEVLAPVHVRPRPGLLVRRGTPAPSEVWQVERYRCTSPLRTAFDLARRLDLAEAVVSVDALARKRPNEPAPFVPADLLGMRRRARGTAGLGRVVALADPRAESPMETRMRLVLVLAGLPRPEVQHRVRTRDGREVRFDLAYPDALLAIEYDSDETHDDRLDRERDVRTAELGWHTLRLQARDITRTPERTAAVVRGLLGKGDTRAVRS